MNTTLEKKLPFGHPSTHPQQPGGYQCKGSNNPFYDAVPMDYHPQQASWMQENKPLYYTGDLDLDIHHLPQHLRHL